MTFNDTEATLEVVVEGNYGDFKKLIEEAPQDKSVAIFTHRFPDPDAISSMMGLSWLLERAFGIQADLFYDGEVSHPQNGTMVNLLSPDLQKVQNYDSDNYSLNIVVDTIPKNAGIGDKKVRFDVVIDHHRDLPVGCKSMLIHKKTGSCAGIIFQMMKDLVPNSKWLSDQSDEDSKLATALICGIMTDTHFMLSDDCTEIERLAFHDLFEYRNHSFLNDIVFFKRKKFWIDRKADAIREAEIDQEGCATVGLGIIPEKERDLIADMADEMVTWSSVETAVAFAVVGGDRIEGCVRSLNSSLTVSDFCGNLGGKIGSGGGKHGKGAYKIPLGGLAFDEDEDVEDAEEAWKSIKKRETKRIRRALIK